MSKEQIEELEWQNKFQRLVICVLLFVIMIGFISMLMMKTGVKDLHDSIIAEIKSGSTMLCDLPVKNENGSETTYCYLKFKDENSAESLPSKVIKPIPQENVTIKDK